MTIIVARAHGGAMRNTTRAGGCFLTFFLLAGFVAGLAIQNPMKGVMIGLGIGIVLAVGLWVIDERRGA